VNGSTSETANPISSTGGRKKSPQKKRAGSVVSRGDKKEIRESVVVIDKPGGKVRSREVSEIPHHGKGRRGKGLRGE